MLKQRILTALVLLPLMIGMLFWADSSLWAAFSGLIALLALWEYARIIHMSPLQNIFYLLITASIGILFYLQTNLFYNFVAGNTNNKSAFLVAGGAIVVEIQMENKI